MKYRPEIDGLRALAVVPVILFHAGFELFSGGFVGVDVFFVISGYLITTILIEDIENQRFSLVNFYERRARRILPALFFVMLVCIPFAWMWMMPNQMKDFSQSLVAVSLFSSNVLFWRESGYFDAAAEEKPLLHTWSLAVEEQYYLLFPIFLILAWRFGKNRVFWMIVVMAAISLLLSEWGWRNKATANFYLAPTRAWELFAGSIAAFIVQKQGVQKNNYLALLGLAAIIFSIFAYDEATPFPSVYALAPVLGVVMLILYADKETLAAKLLSTKAFAGIGLISYSAYLWHQPLFAFTRLTRLENPSTTLMVLVSLISFGLALITWKYIELPFRKSLLTRKLIFSLSFIALSLPIIIGFSLIERIDSANPAANNLKGSSCVNFPKVGSATCVKVENSNPRLHVVIWGDSHSSALRQDVNIPEDITLTSIAHSGCAPLVGLFRFDEIGNSKNCSDARVVFGYADYVNQLKPDVVILTGRWALYLNGWKKKGELQAAHHFMVDSKENFDLIQSSINFRKNLIAEKMIETVDYLNANKVVVLISPPDLADIGMSARIVRKGSVPLMSIAPYNSAVDGLLSSLDGLNILDSRDYFCDDKVCKTTLDSYSLYNDDNHLSAMGSQVIWREILAEYIFKENNIQPK